MKSINDILEASILGDIDASLNATDEVVEFARWYATMQLDGKGEVAEDSIAMLLSGLKYNGNGEWTIDVGAQYDFKGKPGKYDPDRLLIPRTGLPANVKKITFVVTINEALEQGLNFSMVANAYVRVVDKTTGQELNRFQLTDYYANVTAMVVGEVYNHNGQWKFNAVGDGVAKDLAGLCGMYGVNVAG